MEQGDDQFSNAGDEDLLLAFDMKDFAVNQFQQLIYVPEGCAEDWALCFARTANNLIQAIRDQSVYGDRKRAIAFSGCRWGCPN